MSLKENIGYFLLDIATPGIEAAITIQSKIHDKRESKKSDDQKKFEKNLKDELNRIREE